MSVACKASAAPIRSDSEGASAELPPSSAQAQPPGEKGGGEGIALVPLKTSSNGEVSESSSDADESITPRAVVNARQSWSYLSSADPLLHDTSDNGLVDGELTPLPVSKPVRPAGSRSWSSVVTTEKKKTIAAGTPCKATALSGQCVVLGKCMNVVGESKVQRVNGQRPSYSQRHSQRRQAIEHAAHWGVTLSGPQCPVKSFSRSQTLILFDWDDTLLPSSWLADCELTLDTHSIPTPHEREYLDDISRSVCALLVAAVHCGRVVVVTNAESGWVDLSAAKFMPSVLETLRKWHISVISARTEFESVQCQHPVQWKVEAFRQLLALAYPTMNLDRRSESRPRFPNHRHAKGRPETGGSATPVKAREIITGRPLSSGINVVSFGDSDSERIALIQCVRALNRVVEKKLQRTHFYKSFKLCEHPTPMILHRQLQLVQKLLPQIIHHEGNLDLRVNFKVSPQMDRALEEKTPMFPSKGVGDPRPPPMTCQEEVSTGAS